MRLIHVLGMLIASAGTAEAQGVSLWLGAGRPNGDSTSITLRNSEVYVGLQVGLPVVPVAVRVEGMTSLSDFGSAPRSFIANAVLPLRLPGVQPYVIGGYGAYSYGEPLEVRGVNYGAGVRFGLSRTGVFGEVRRHQRLDRNVVTVGITL
ncbi:MAG: hypothetical protein IT361_08030 [Gemmatimonadaceae bacterium]|nr:hypothetical protein [Gemmatimonadaceae bacterium]